MLRNPCPQLLSRGGQASRVPGCVLLPTALVWGEASASQPSAALGHFHSAVHSKAKCLGLISSPRAEPNGMVW